MAKNEGFEAEFTSYKSGQQKYFRINISDLKIHLRDFKSSIKSTDVSGLVVGVVGVWVPLFTSDFKSFWSLSSDTVRGVYIGIAIILTLVLVKRMGMHWFNKTRAYFNKQNLTKYETDPDKLADDMYSAVPDGTKKLD